MSQRLSHVLIGLFVVLLVVPNWAHEGEHAPVPAPDRSAGQQLPMPEGVLVGTTLHLASGDVTVPKGWTWSQLPGTGDPQYMGMPADGPFRALVLAGSRRRVIPKRYVEAFNQSFAKSFGKDVVPQATYAPSDRPFADSLKAEFKFVDSNAHELAKGLSYVGLKPGEFFAVSGVGVEAPIADVESVLKSFAPRPMTLLERFMASLSWLGLAACGVVVGWLIASPSKLARVGAILLTIVSLGMIGLNTTIDGSQAGLLSGGLFVGGAVAFLGVSKMLVRRSPS